jgi:hypothetical protein
MGHYTQPRRTSNSEILISLIGFSDANRALRLREFLSLFDSQADPPPA